ncbi:MULTISPECIES: bifunctional metallophosphatase/5'-nucleotidase [Dictyoglomus]|jgi:2',3'-cyclic-nucleotide 2'-phosphodiesterase (5'-nucleotidase family)|uniref:5'-nucleotidase n=1 Tax=Dictyoglomus turgidum (strain DSM 6724 / Z-1310) TaxID=515635 RepID=B8E0P6_DICTD|nr:MULTISPECIES: bifunctional UDP-sugar hydrolase/5'-nucleotidase [Dictyoglomus]ACK43066.1 5'-nucleotidase [Dictyoglomus turgidum DSM 6724]PNV78666.1 MAG: bifunctional metallophosphatase/5'-nucleotidase [Dictyoglomus turgidum]HBU31116.1 bifunctional metallophosphatase/5'-nucleotidase [Dictyoglomus sp.]
MRHFKKFSLLLIVFFLFSSLIFAQELKPIEIKILHINDFHGRLQPYIVKSISETIPVGGGAYLSYLINEERSKNPDGTILLSAGDMFQGTPISNIFKGEPVIKMMNYLKFDAMTIGNHEFDWGQELLQTWIKNSNFPYLASNIIKNGDYLPNVKPYVILERKGLKIAIIGLTTPETAYIVKPDYVKDLTFLEPEKVLPNLIKEVKEKGAQLIVVLSHLGYDADKKLAENVQGIDVIVGGHSHTVVTKPTIVRGTIIVQAGYNGIYLGVLDLKIQPETGIILDFTRENELKTVFAAPENKYDTEVANLIETYNSQLKEEFSKVVGETLVDLVRNYNEESNVGNAICDAMLEASKAQIAFQNSGGIRIDIPKGKITMEQVYSLLPFDNVLVEMDLTGKDILDLLEQSATLEKGILQVAGIKVKYDMKRPIGSRVIEVFVNEEPLNPNKVYRVVTNDFLAAGGDKFIAFTRGKNITYGDMLRDVFVEYLKKHSPISPKVEGRSIVIK